MSSALGIASVSAVLVDLLDNGLIDNDITGAVGPVTVSALPPDKVETGGTNQQSRLNLFLYRVTPNPAWRNVGLPSRDANGELTGDHALALDLHYLLSAYGTADFHAEILLGYAMQILHDTPALARDAIRRSLAPVGSPPVAGGLPPHLRTLFTSGLADQFEQIRLTPESLSTEEISKLWSAFQTNYRPTAGYVASVVLIDSQRRPQAALPVLARHLRVDTLRQPVVEDVRVDPASISPPSASDWVFSDSTLIVSGRQLDGEDVSVRLSGVEVAPQSVTDRVIRTTLPAGVEAGIHGLQVVHQVALGSPPVPHRGVESSAIAVTVHPRIGSIQTSAVTDQGGGLFGANFDLTVAPGLGARQPASLLLNETGAGANARPRSYRFPVPERTVAAAALSVPVTGVAAGDYLVRLQVDGVDSPLSTNAQGLFDGPLETLP